ncbi:hypothetical protein [Cylindrospermopsis raciborskii]|uniref:hypothetical protein n=1 Tax=Cylindrospermopsis raciborskii TaxID=77022 RepID=UPI0021557343|nr:hypothetical protein [Cylindrospermopsis raciborskii]
MLKGDRAGLPTGHRSHLGTFHVRFAVAVGKTLTENVFRQRMNQLFQGVEDIWRAIAISDYPPVPFQGKNLNMGTGDCEALPTGDRIALPTGDRSHLGAFQIRFPFGKTLTVNVFRQRINQLFQGVEDIWRGIAKYSPRAIALYSLW